MSSTTIETTIEDTSMMVTNSSLTTGAPTYDLTSHIIANTTENIILPSTEEISMTHLQTDCQTDDVTTPDFQSTANSTQMAYTGEEDSNTISSLAKNVTTQMKVTTPEGLLYSTDLTTENSTSILPLNVSQMDNNETSTMQITKEHTYFITSETTLNTSAQKATTTEAFVNESSTDFEITKLSHTSTDGRQPSSAGGDELSSHTYHLEMTSISQHEASQEISNNKTAQIVLGVGIGLGALMVLGLSFIIYKR